MFNAFEASLKLIGYNLSSAGERLKQIQSLSQDEFHKWQNDQKWKIARFHYDNNLFYRKKIGKYFPTIWEDLPILKKSDYQGDLEELLSNSYTRDNTYIGKTSGSSGQPFLYAKNKEAHAMDWALIKDRYEWHGLDLSSKQARFWASPIEKWSKIKEKIKDIMMNRVRFSVLDQSDEKHTDYLSIIKKRQFNYIYGYTNSLVLFARFLLRKNIVLRNVCSTLKCCFTTSEMLLPEERTILSKAFGVNIVNEYGASEVGLIAFESPKKEWLLCEEVLFHETIGLNDSVVNGHEGNIVLTDLDNEAMPFIRYNVGDIGVISEYSRTDGKYRKLKHLLGRETERIFLPNGKIMHGSAFSYIFKSFLDSSSNLREFIARQTALDTFVIEIVSDRELNDKEIKKLKKKVDLYLEPKLNLEIKRVSKIIRSPSGKHKYFISDIM